MQERRANNWARCPRCGHKLFRILDSSPIMIEVSSRMIVDGMPKPKGDSILETKCHSCKEIVDIRLVEI